MKTLFINLGNTFCSTKSFLSSGKIPFDLTEENRDCFDWISIGLIRKICKNRDIQIVAFSQFNYANDSQEISKYFDLNIIEFIKPETRISTDSGFSLEVFGSFEKMVGLWIKYNLYQGDYLILDTAKKMEFISFVHFIHIDEQEGFLFKNYQQICEYFSIAS